MSLQYEIVKLIVANLGISDKIDKEHFLSILNHKTNIYIEGDNLKFPLFAMKSKYQDKDFKICIVIIQGELFGIVSLADCAYGFFLEEDVGEIFFKSEKWILAPPQMQGMFLSGMEDLKNFNGIWEIDTQPEKHSLLELINFYDSLTES